MIVDSHIHWPVGEDSDPAAFLKMLDSYQIDLALVSGWEVLFKLKTCSYWNDLLAEFCRKSSGRLYPLATVHLAQGKEALDEAQRCLEELAVKGFKVHPWMQAESVFCETMYELCRLAAQHNVPLLFHDGTPPNALSSQIGVLANMFGDTNFILGHGGLLHYWQEAIEVAKQNSNIFLTLCGQHPWAMQHICDQIDNDRIVFGTDYLGPGTEELIPYRKGLVARLHLSEKQRKKIMNENAMRIYRINT